MLVRTMARTLEVVNGAEALFELDGLHKAERYQQQRDDKQDIRVDKAANRADQRNQSAHHGDDEQTQHVEFSAQNEIFEALTLGWFLTHAMTFLPGKWLFNKPYIVFFRRKKENPF